MKTNRQEFKIVARNSINFWSKFDLWPIYSTTKRSRNTFDALSIRLSFISNRDFLSVLLSVKWNMFGWIYYKWGFCGWSIHATRRVGRSLRNYRQLSARHRSYLNDFEDNCQKLVECIDHNDKMINHIIEDVQNIFVNAFADSKKKVYNRKIKNSSGWFIYHKWFTTHWKVDKLIFYVLRPKMSSFKIKNS